jgi:uncharacterized membrane protein YphA (DoxX/SURF4 family)
VPLFREYEYDRQPFVRTLISIIACLIVGLTLIFASTGKLAGVGDIPGQTEYIDRFIPDFLITPELAYFVGFVFIPWLLPIAELIIGLMLVVGIWPRLAAILFLPLVFGFMANNAYMIATGVDKYPTCECFGIWERLVGGLTPTQSLYFDVALFILAVIIIIVHPAPFFSNQPWINRLFAREKK